MVSFSTRLLHTDRKLLQWIFALEQHYTPNLSCKATELRQSWGAFSTLSCGFRTYLHTIRPKIMFYRRDTVNDLYLHLTAEVPFEWELSEERTAIVLITRFCNKNTLTCLVAHMSVTVRFLQWSKSNLKTAIEWQTKHWTKVSDLLPVTFALIYVYRNDSVREVSAAGIPLTKICIALLYGVVQSFQWWFHLFPIFSFKCCDALVLINHFVGSGPQIVTFL